MRFNSQTAARFAAASLVFLHHSTAEEFAAVYSTYWHRFFQNGYVGAFFFILSGFVIATSSLDKLGRPSVRGLTAF